MPTAVWTPAFAITASGREVEFPLLFYAIWDLHDWGYITAWEYETMRFWINQYKNGLAMPGTMLFRDVWAGERVPFTYFLDGLYEMFMAAVNDADVTTESEADEVMEELLGADIDLWFPWPVNIGRFGLLPVTNENTPIWLA